MSDTQSSRGPAPYANPYLAGIGLGLVLLAAFVLVGRGLGASGAATAVVAWGVNAASPSHARSLEWLSGRLATGESPLKEWLVFEGIGVFLGALVSGLLARRTAVMIEKGPRVSSAARLSLAFAGGALMAVGAAFAGGCTSGQALTGGALLNLGSWVFMMMVFAGAYAVAAFMKWEWR